jgi:hypothetical protein
MGALGSQQYKHIWYWQYIATAVVDVARMLDCLLLQQQSTKTRTLADTFASLLDLQLCSRLQVAPVSVDL